MMPVLRRRHIAALTGRSYCSVRQGSSTCELTTQGATWRQYNQTCATLTHRDS